MDAQLEGYMRQVVEPRTGFDEHVLVLIDEHSHARTLIRGGWRIAQGSHAGLVVVYFRSVFSSDQERELAQSVELAEDLNARVVPIDADDIAGALAAFMQEEGVHHIVLPHIRRGAAQRVLRRSLADQLMLAIADLEVHLITPTAE